MNRIVTTVFVVLFGIQVAADDQIELSAHQRSLLLAQLEDLLNRLALPALPEIKIQADPKNLTLEVSPSVVQRKDLAGVGIVRLPTVLSGRPAVVLDWLKNAAESGWAITPPLKIQTTHSRVSLECILWAAVAGQKANQLDRQAANQALTKLKDNLLWLEKRRSNSTPMIDLIDLFVDSETVRVVSASLHKNVLRLSASATTDESWQYFNSLLNQRRKKMEVKPSLQIDKKTIPKLADDIGQAGLNMNNLNSSDALRLAAQLFGSNIIAALHKDTQLNGFIQADDKSGLLDSLFEKLSLNHQKIGAISIASAKLSKKPSELSSFANRPVDLFFHNSSPEPVFRLLADISRINLVPPALSDLKLTIMLRNQPVRLATALVAWALQLTPLEHGGLVTFLPADTQAPTLNDKDEVRVSLAADFAPLAKIVAELTGFEQISECTETASPVSLHARQVSAKNISAMLLAVRKLKLVHSHTKHMFVSQTLPDQTLKNLKCTQRKPPSAELAVNATIKRQKIYKALVRDKSGFRWVIKGDTLEDGSQVRAIRQNRVVLKNKSGKINSLSLGSVEIKDNPRRPSTTTDIPLARLRLAGTLRIGDKSAAILVGPEGDSHLVRPGHLVGRRCAKVTRITSGTVEFSLGCPSKNDPPETRLILTPNQN
ncbi:MAG: hypothetical protein JRJ87_17485 [Deltaproteobacteria bacterium]|nr:hypothetical protein [Deltaproteobacteria bacterium]